MDVASLLVELYGRIPPLARRAVEGLPLEDLTTPPAPHANPIAWLIWHLARVQDDHVADVLGVEQLWVTGDWAHRFGLDPDPSNTGYGHGPEDVAAVRPSSPASSSSTSTPWTPVPAPCWRSWRRRTWIASSTARGTRPSPSASGW